VSLYVDYESFGSRLANRVQINAYYKTTKVFLSLHSCKTVVGDSQSNIRNILNAIIGALYKPHGFTDRD